MKILVIVILILIILKINQNKNLPKVAISCMTRKPIDFKKWLDHHFNMGIHKIFLRIEETPELKNIIDNHRFKKRINAMYFNTVDKTNNWHTIQKRQENFTNQVIDICKNEKIDWLFQNIDDDELLYIKSKNIPVFLKSKNKYEAIFVPTVEAVYPKVNTNSCFTTDLFFKCDDRALCTSYYGGKSGAKITDTLKPYGPHKFDISDEKYYNSTESEIVILHHESCSFDKWKTKYSNMNVTDKKIPKGFQFYNDSIREVQTQNPKHMHKFFSKNKVDPYYDNTKTKIKFSY
tara:strand:+ start:1340 stop:2209 length:870 start_codon:yes stop_codon:yes gene_type:complete